MKLKLFTLTLLVLALTTLNSISQDKGGSDQIISEEYGNVKKESLELIKNKRFDSARSLLKGFVNRSFRLSPEHPVFDEINTWLKTLDKELHNHFEEESTEIKNLVTKHQYLDALKSWEELGSWEAKEFRPKVQTLLSEIVQTASKYHRHEFTRLKDANNTAEAIYHLRELLFYTESPQEIQTINQDILKLIQEVKQKFFEEYILSKKDDLSQGKFKELITYYEKLQKDEPIKDFSEYLGLIIIRLKSLQQESKGFTEIEQEWRQDLEKAEISLGRIKRPPEAEECLDCQRGRVYCARCLASGKVFKPCPKCTGKEPAPCETCQGKGTVLCKKCEGTGRQGKCSTCKGKGDVLVKPCGICGGKGYKEYVGGSYKIECAACKGIGGEHKPCPKCTGAKTKECIQCKGSGEIKCPDCGNAQKGPGPCPTCQGKKQVATDCPDCNTLGYTFCLVCRGKGWTTKFEREIRKHLRPDKE